ncbi:ANTAR domain-containing protein [Streptomyces sp. EN27]|uniref:ANTAR domain-containing protein n=1 Tax=Streptomyces sp. EN27 TaxID=211464 RepID=UPI00114D37E6|nr:ANTAR domain-containing protein [Streptomyces sp. EN27]
MQNPLASGQEHEHAAAIPRDPLLAEQEILFLRRELNELRTALHSRPMIDIAIGMVMVAEGCSRDEAWLILVNSSQRTNTKLRTLASRLTENSATFLSLDRLRGAPDISARDETIAQDPMAALEDPTSSHFSTREPVTAADNSRHSTTEDSRPPPPGTRIAARPRE